MNRFPSSFKARGGRLVVLALAACALLSGCRAQQRPDGGRGYLSAGAHAPDLTGKDHRGQLVPLRAEVVTLVYFYPRSGTPGCTKEACAFRDAWTRFADAGVRVVGVSSDSNERQQKFAKEHQLPFSLIADPDHVWSDAFGVGSFLGFDARVSFLIDAEARVAKVYEDVDPGVHAEEVLADVRQLGLARESLDANAP